MWLWCPSSSKIIYSNTELEINPNAKVFLMLFCDFDTSHRAHLYILLPVHLQMSASEKLLGGELSMQPLLNEELYSQRLSFPQF